MGSLIIALLLGAAVSLATWSIYTIYSEVPQEDRSYLDRPPFGFRIVWPLIKLFVHYIGPRMSLRYRLDTQAKLRKAGVDYSLSPEQFFAGKLVAAIFAVLFMKVLLLMLDDQSFAIMLLAAIGGYFYPTLWLKEVIEKRQRRIFKDLPFYLDIITLSVEAGTNLTGAFTQAVQKAPDGPLKTEFSRMLRDVRAGKPRAVAMRSMADRVQMSGVNSLVSSLVQAEKIGSSLGSVLRAQADQRRSERFLKAEKMAMEAPVKLLGPLIMFIFPNTFLVLIFVLLVKAVQAGVLNWGPLVWSLTWPG